MKPVAFLCVLAATACFAAGSSPCGMTEPVPSAMRPLPPGALRLHGIVDDAIRKSVENWTLGKVPYREFAEFFRKGRPQFALGEMWGKFVRAAALQYRYTGDERIRAVIEDAVRDVLSAERENGSISCDPPESQPGGRGGDLWERKYVMLGLERYLEYVKDDPAARDSLARQADCIISQIGESPKADIRSLGWSANHIESSTLLEPFVNLYAMTGESRFLRFARYVVDSGGTLGYNLVQQACDNVSPHEMGGVYPKAYEMLSFFEGLIEYCRFTGDERVRCACLNLFSNILTNELTIVGNGGGDQPYHPKVMGEAWDRTAFEQTNPAMKRMMETCVGVTWLKFCGRILSLTGDVRAADAMERYIYNGLLGAMTPNGDGFSYVNLLNGRKTTNEGWGWDFPSCRVTCCNLNGPIGLAYVPYYAVMQGEDGPVVNFYEAFDATVRVGAEEVRLSAPSSFTDGDVWKLDIAPERETRFTMRLRIPGWSERTRVCVCGEDVADVKAGCYLDIDRLWRKGDRVEISFDWRARKVSAPKGSNRTGDNFAAVTWGPIVLSRDENTDPQFGADVDVVADRDGFVAVEKVALPDARHRLEFVVSTSDGSIRMCDYASVDSWNGKRVMTWLPAKGVKVSSFGYDASDSTRFLQAALDSGEKKIVIDRMDGPWVTEPLFARSNQEILFESGVELVAKKGAFQGKRDCLMVLKGVTNVTIRGEKGSTLRMRRDDYAAPPYVRSEWRHALAIRNSRNVKIVGMTFAESGGDGVVVSGGSENVELLDCVMTRNFRQGVSVISCKGFLAEGCLFEKTQGTNPESGIDFEPDRPGDRLVSCMVRNCRSIENAGSAFHVAPVMLDSSSEPIGVRFENCVSENDGMGVEIALYRSGNYPTGRVVFAGCEFRSPRRGCLFVNKPFGTMDVAFANCQFFDAKDADFLFQTEQWDFDPPDGIRFSNVFCRQPVDRPVFSFPVPGFGRNVDSLSGTIKLESPSGLRTINLSPEWCAANIPRASGGEPKPRMEADVTSLWPLGNAGCEMRQIGPVALAHRQRLILRVDTPRNVRLSVRQIPGRSKMYSPIPLKIRRVGGGFHREIPMPKDGLAEVSFDAVTPGHYAMELDAYHSRFVIDAANVPIAVDATGRYREFCLPPGEETFEFSFIAKKDAPFSLLTRVIYSDDDYACELFDSSGRKIAGRQLPHGWNVMEGDADGLVRAVFTRQGGSSLHVGNVFVDLTGAPGLLFLSADGARDCRPETWFHVIGGNASKAGLTADLEALKDAGFGGIQFFHGQWGEAEAWEGVAEQIPCLSPKWDELVAYAADECARLGLSFKMQNCPGWSMSGGPWIAPSNAMRKLVYARRDVRSNGELVGRVVPNAPNGSCDGVGTRRPTIPDIPIPKEYRDADSDWHDVCYLAFPTPEGGAANGVAVDGGAADGDVLTPVSVETNGNVRVFNFEKPVTVRTLELPSPSQLNHAWSYNPDTHVLFEAKMESGWKIVCDVDYPQGCWQDKVPFSVACEDCEAKIWRLTTTASHPIRLPFVRLNQAARLDNWEGKAGHVLRGLMKRPAPRQDVAAYVPRNAVRVVRPGDVLPGDWTVLRVGHVNMKKKNAPAPKEATGWECDKLDPRGIEVNFAGYIGRLADGPLKGGKLNGMIVDSWECERQTWTWRMPEWFRDENGYDVKSILPAVFGWVIGTPAETDRILLDWRRTVSGLITKNYYGRMAELAHSKELAVAYETAFGDVIPGDILEYWKYCDTPMCEFWQPYTPDKGGAGHPNYKPVRPCVSAAHLYSKPRVDCEAFTSMKLTWDENFRTLKEQAVRHFARGVTHLVFHTYTHQPQTDGRVPGTSFGSYIGTPFVRGQTWWLFMRSFTDWAAECCAFLERGKPVVDVLRYLGDDLDHRPNELEYFPEGFKNDYLNADVLFGRLDVKDGRFVLPDGMSYKVIWVPPSVMVLPETRKRLDALAAKGGRVVYGTADDAVAGLKPQIVVGRVVPNAPSDGCGGVGTRRPTGASPLWYHRVDGDSDLFFVAADEKGFKGEATLSTQHGEKTLALDLAPFENGLLEFSADFVPSVPSVPSVPLAPSISLDSWTLSFPSGWGAPERMKLNHLVPWKDLPGVSEQGRSFSGTATYTAHISLPHSPFPIPRSLFLDLGEVRDFARVFVNGHEVAALWAEPYRCDISSCAKLGRNELRIEVTSSWFNRLAYDFRQPPERRKTWTTWTARGVPCLKPDADLRPSGLLGPVRISFQGGQLRP